MKLFHLSTFGRRPTPTLLATLSLLVFSSNSNNGYNVAYGQSDGDCFGELITTEVSRTNLNILDSRVTNNTLHLEGGELRYTNVGEVRNRDVDLVVTVDSGDYTDIADVWSDRGLDPDDKNGKNEAFGKINLQTVQGKPLSGRGEFKFCFHDTETNELVSPEAFSFTVYDWDNRNHDNGKNGIGLKEKLLVDTSQLALYQLWPNENDSEINLYCEDGSATPCASGIRTVFHAGNAGTGGDNPRDPENLTPQQKVRSATFTFTNTDCWTFAYEHYCPVEQDHTVIFPLGYDPNDDNKNNGRCRGYSGGNFLFSGDADSIIETAECIVPPSTPQPTRDPTVSPTAPPTKEPTKSPTLSPTNPRVRTVTTPQPLCIDGGVILEKTFGLTEFPTTPKPVEITNVGTDDDGYSTVTVISSQLWSRSSSVGHVFASYKDSVYNEVCIEDQNVDGDSMIFGEAITIHCNVMTPWAHLKICVADDIGNDILTDGDDAKIPKCCYPEIPEESGKVCYNLKISCKPECVHSAQEDRRMLRGEN